MIRASTVDAGPTVGQRVALFAGLLFCCLIPSDWTQDIPERYGDRHPGLRHSALYPEIDSEQDQ